VSLEFYSSVGFEYYTGFYEISDLKQCAYLAVVEAKGYHTNFEKFYIIKEISSMKGIPMVPKLDDG
jgi:hypothetical protein